MLCFAPNPPLSPHRRCAQRGAASPCGVRWCRMDMGSGWDTPLPLPAPPTPLPARRSPLPAKRIHLLTPPSPLPVPPTPLPAPKSPLPATEHHLLTLPSPLPVMPNPLPVMPSPLPVMPSPLPAPPPSAWLFPLSLPAGGRQRSGWGRSFARLSTNWGRCCGESAPLRPGGEHGGSGGVGPEVEWEEPEVGAGRAGKGLGKVNSHGWGRKWGLENRKWGLGEGRYEG